MNNLAERIFNAAYRVTDPEIKKDLENLANDVSKMETNQILLHQHITLLNKDLKEAYGELNTQESQQAIRA